MTGKGGRCPEKVGQRLAVLVYGPLCVAVINPVEILDNLRRKRLAHRDEQYARLALDALPSASQLPARGPDDAADGHRFPVL